MGITDAEDVADGGSTVDEVLRTLLATQPDHLRIFYGMMSYQLGLVDAQLVPRPEPGGSPLSTQICILSARSVGANAAAQRAAAAITLLANWFVLHADIERQHAHTAAGPAVWSLWGVPQAINAGDGLFPLAVTAMLDAATEETIALGLVRELTETSLAYMSGQYLLLSTGASGPVPDSEYLRAIEQTSGRLAGYAAWVGAVVGGGEGALPEDLRAFGAALGTAADIRDKIASPRMGDAPAPPAWTPSHVRRYLDDALAALRHAALPGVEKRRLEAFARQRCAL